MTENWMYTVLAGGGALLIFLTILVARAFVVIGRLSKEVAHHDATLDHIYENRVKIEDSIAKVDDRCEKIKGSVEVVSAMLTDGRRRLESRMEDIENSHETMLVKVVNKLAEAIDRQNGTLIRTAFVSAPEAITRLPARYSEAAPDGDTDGDDVLIQRIPGKGTDTYQWSFPTVGNGGTVLIGERYIVVGKSGWHVNADGSSLLSTWETTWNGRSFVDDDGLPIDTVYAYIRQPSASDIMEKIVGLELSEAAEGVTT